MKKILRSCLILPIVSFYLYLTGCAPFLGQWDSFDYLKQIASHHLSDLGIGRPVYLGYNILLWESLRSIFRLQLLHLEFVIMAGTILLGVIGAILFQRLSCRILPKPAATMAALVFAISPVYAIYSGFIMTEVPMLVALLAAALIMWQPEGRNTWWSDIAGGIFFGLAVGIREQALTLGAAYLWILFARGGSNRFRSALRFFLAAAVVTLAPAIAWYFFDPAGFMERTQTWFHAIPMGSVQFRNNMQASLLFTFVICPGAWLAVACAGIRRIFSRKSLIPVQHAALAPVIPHPIWGFICCLVLPVAILWRDADIQMHPRYALIILPASAILCASLFRRWIPSKRGLVVWAVMQVLFFGMAMAAFSQYKQTQTGKMEFARLMCESIQGPGLMIAGNYSPILDYYRGIGVRPEWQIVWSGWDWNALAVEAKVTEAWNNHIPVYWSTDPPGWSYFERELLEAYFIFKDCKKERIAPHLYRIRPPY
jgi:4-amino-4-deoxy-L-arabinose transferase-like glycosyltransferase